MHVQKRNPLSNMGKIVRDGRYPLVITYGKFGDDRSGVWGWRGQILPYPIDFDRHPCNAVALPRECVIVVVWIEHVPAYACCANLFTLTH